MFEIKPSFLVDNTGVWFPPRTLISDSETDDNWPSRIDMKQHSERREWNMANHVAYTSRYVREPTIAILVVDDTH